MSYLKNVTEILRSEILPVDILLLYQASHREQFPGGLTAKVLKREVVGIGRTVERRVQRAVILAVHIDAPAQINVRIAPRRRRYLPTGVVLHESELVFADACDDAVEVPAHRHTPLLTGNHLQVHTQMRVREEVLEEPAVNILRSGGLAFCLPVAQSDGKRFVTVLQIVMQDFSCEARAVLYFKPCARFCIHFAM